MVVIFRLSEDLAGTELSEIRFFEGSIFMDVLYEAVLTFGNVGSNAASRQATGSSVGSVRIVAVAFAHFAPECIG